MKIVMSRAVRPPIAAPVPDWSVSQSLITSLAEDVLAMALPREEAIQDHLARRCGARLRRTVGGSMSVPEIVAHSRTGHQIA